MAKTSTIYGSGVAAEDGGYGIELDLDALYALITGEPEARSPEEDFRVEADKAAPAFRGLRPDMKEYANDLAKLRWGIIWPHSEVLETDEDRAHIKALREKLGDLVDFRVKQMKQKEPRNFYYKHNQLFADFLDDLGLGLYMPQYDVLPYYLLIVGSPEQIPWEFQQYLDRDYAVGRLWFDDPNDCGRYVKHLLDFEKTCPTVSKKIPRREVMLVGTQHPCDPTTKNSANRLIKPIHDWLGKEKVGGYGSELILGTTDGGGAYKKNVTSRLSGQDGAGHPQDPPALLFMACHGLSWKEPNPAQFSKQGALLFQEWPNRLAKPLPDYWLAGDEVSKLSIAGMVAFCWTCFGAGTPLMDDWHQPKKGVKPSSSVLSFLKHPQKIATRPFVARLPQKMLAHGAMAFIGHVSRTWDMSFLGPDRAKSQHGLFTVTLGEMLRGRMVGHATDMLNDTWPKLTDELDHWLQSGTKGKEETVALWLARNDLRGYVVLGDPAAKLQAKPPG